MEVSFEISLWSTIIELALKSYRGGKQSCMGEGKI